MSIAPFCQPASIVEREAGRFSLGMVDELKRSHRHLLERHALVILHQTSRETLRHKSSLRLQRPTQIENDFSSGAG
jgi:hypothetical protein